MPSSSGSLFYRLAYRSGFTPWESAGVPAELKSLTEGSEALAPGRALDLGCGAGGHSVYLAAHGWEVTGVDFVSRALERASRRSRAADVSVRWVRADITRLADAGIGRDYTLLYDHGCFHGLSDAERNRYAHQVTGLAAPGATFLLMAFAPRRGPGPAGASAQELTERFGDVWELVSSAPSGGPQPPGPMRNASLVWHRLRRHDPGGSEPVPDSRSRWPAHEHRRRAGG